MNPAAENLSHIGTSGWSFSSNHILRTQLPRPAPSWYPGCVICP